MSVLGVERGGAEARQRVTLGRLLRRFAVLLAVTLLCGASYIAGIWMAARTTTCVASGPGVLVCGTSPAAPPKAPAEPARTPERGGEA
jgi:hypothetical protein